MPMKENVTRLRALIADARTLRGLPATYPITDLDTAMQRAQELRIRHLIAPPTAPYPIRRKHLLARVRATSRSYGFADHVTDFVLANGADSVVGLDVDALDALTGWLEDMVETLQAANDWEHVPPAR